MLEPAPFMLLLGMHRSGTSCLMGALETCGLFLGDVRRHGRHNAKGYFELTALTHLHESILRDNRGSWDRPTPTITVMPERLESLRHIVDLYRRFRPCGIKDPRTLLVLDAWRTLIEPLSLLGSFRHPLAVARSLATRNGMPETQALDLWCTYNTALVRQHQRQAFPLIEYDLENPTAYCASIEQVARSFGLEPDATALRAFVDAQLDHQRCLEPVPASCRDLWDYLCDHRVRATVAPSSTVECDPATQALPIVQTSPPASVPHRATHWCLRQLRAGQLRIERARHRSRAGHFDRSELRSLVLFVGNARSGTTLVRSLVDSHPHALLANEVNLLQRLREGESWEMVLGRLVESARHFRLRPEWEGYRYRLDTERVAASARLIGDKKAGASARLLLENVLLLDKLLAWSPVPVQFIHCVRNPFDVIATKTHRNGLALAWNIERYFEVEQTAAYLHERLGPSGCHVVHLERLIASPRATLLSLHEYLNLEPDESHLAACERLIFPRPSKTAGRQSWSPQTIEAVLQKAGHCPHLSPYITEGLSLAHSAIEAFRQTLDTAS